MTFFLHILSQTQVRAFLRPRYLKAGGLMRRWIGQVIAPLLIILRVANKTALTNNTIVSGRIGTFKARARRQSTGGDGSYPSEDSMSLLDEFGTNSAEPRVEVETTIESHPDKARAS